MVDPKESLSVIEYVTEEVIRQGHDVLVLDGIQRVGWMLNGWAYALGQGGRPTSVDAVLIGKLVEPYENRGGMRTCGVRVGPRICPPFEKVTDLLLELDKKKLKPMDFYREFEMIHPFVDGNGRTGKILLNWLNGTLLEPIFPPNDFWGEIIKNP